MGSGELEAAWPGRLSGRPQPPRKAQAPGKAEPAGLTVTVGPHTPPRPLRGPNLGITSISSSPSPPASA